MKIYAKEVTTNSMKTASRSKILMFGGLLLVLIGFCLLGLTMLMQVQQFAVKYAEFLQMLDDWDAAIAGIPNKGLVVIAILLIYISKAIVPIPISAVCVIAGMVFPTELAAAINIVGFVLLCTIKYFWGKHLGSGFIYKFLCRYENVRRILESDSTAKDALLVGFRLVPSFPINTVSQLYGAMEFDFYKYIFLSMLGFLPKIISYSMVGRHVFNPFSLAFMLPLVIIFVISGIAMIGINAFIDLFNRKDKIREE